MKKKPDIAAFLEGGAADAANNNEVITQQQTIENFQPTLSTRVHREQKVFRLPLDLINALKRESYEQSIKNGIRVTETELVEKALRTYLDI